MMLFALRMLEKSPEHARALVRALSHTNPHVKLNALDTLWSAVRDGQDISDALPALRKALRDKNDDVKRSVARALTHYYLNKGYRKELNELVRDNEEDSFVIMGVIDARKERWHAPEGPVYFKGP